LFTLLFVGTVMAATLFPSVLGAQFAALDPFVRWVHSGEPRRLRGSATVERGSGVVARMLGVLASLPAAMRDAPIEVRIEASGTGEKWVRLFDGRHLMVSTLKRDGELLVERLGPATLKFRLLVRDDTLEWVLEHIAAFGIALPLKWFRIAATIKARDGRYHFVVDSELIGVGRIVRYEGLLDAAA
jgi:Domain of unknown function (DUF4166)